jgi:hypothetical protein
VAVRYSIRQLLYDIGLTLRDAHQFVTTQQGAPNEVIIAKLAVGRPDRYIDSELFVWDLPADASASNPFYVRTSGTDGKLTLTEAVGTTAIPAGATVILQNINGKGRPHVLKEQALRFALLSMDAMLHTKVSLTVADLDDTTYWQAIPAGLDSIYKVGIYDADYPLAYYEPSPTSWRELDLEGNRIYIPFDLLGNKVVELYGRASLDWQTLMNSNYEYFIDIDPVRVVKDAIQWLLMFDRDQQSNALAANLFNERLRTRRMVPYPDEVFLNRPVVQPVL